jgi:hypothetical protein
LKIQALLRATELFKKVTKLLCLVKKMKACSLRASPTNFHDEFQPMNVKIQALLRATEILKK